MRRAIVRTTLTAIVVGSLSLVAPQPAAACSIIESTSASPTLKERVAGSGLAFLGRVVAAEDYVEDGERRIGHVVEVDTVFNGTIRERVIVTTSTGDMCDPDPMLHGMQFFVFGHATEELDNPTYRRPVFGGPDEAKVRAVVGPGYPPAPGSRPEVEEFERDLAPEQSGRWAAVAAGLVLVIGFGCWLVRRRRTR